MINGKDITTREDIEKLVKTFYEYVIPDPEIGHFFTDIVKVNWEKHFPKMFDFWEDILLDTNNFSGNPMTAHIQLHSKSSMQEKHFERWLLLFNRTLDENFTGPVTEKAKQRALSIATVMRIKLSEEIK